MPSENTGNVITAVKFLKDRIAIYFGKTKIEISEEAFTSSYFYVGKSFTDVEIEKIIHDNQVGFALKYAKSLLAKKMMSEWSLRSKLYEKEFTKDIVDDAIVILKKEKLINDKALCKEYIAYYNEKLYGKNRIIQELKLKGIFDETIKELVFSEANELKKAKALFPKLEKQYDKLPHTEKKRHIYNALIRHGFSNEVALQVVKRIKISIKDEENPKLRLDFRIALDKAKRNYNTPDGIKAYVFKALSQKGYSVSDVRKLWEEKYGK